MEPLGDMLRRLRREAMLSQEELAAAAGLSVRAFRDLETGRVARPRPATLRLIGTALQLDEASTAALRAAAVSTGASTVGPGPRLPPSAATGQPAQLPMAPGGFVGRGRELRRLDGLLDARPASSVYAVSGTAGVGKTALALHWAHAHVAQFPGGQLFLDLHGFDAQRGPVPADEALRALLRAVGVADDQVLSTWTRRPPCSAAGSPGGSCCWFSTTPRRWIRSAP